MSRIGKKPVLIPNGVNVNLSEREITIKGPKGVLNRVIPPYVKVTYEDSVVTVDGVEGKTKSGAYQGLARTLIANMVIGVTEGFEKKMKVEGVGYRVQHEGKTLSLYLGFSKPIDFLLPEGIDVEVGDRGIFFTLKGIDKEALGQTAATIRRYRSPEPYKGKGVRYVDEVVRRKAGKAGSK